MQTIVVRESQDSIGALAIVLKNFGAELIYDYPRMEGLLRDYSHGPNREIQVLLMIARSGIAPELFANAKNPNLLDLGRYHAVLMDEYWLSADAAKWGVAAWQAAIENAKHVPSPKQQRRLLPVLHRARTLVRLFLHAIAAQFALISSVVFMVCISIACLAAVVLSVGIVGALVFSGFSQSGNSRFQQEEVMADGTMEFRPANFDTQPPSATDTLTNLIECGFYAGLILGYILAGFDSAIIIYRHGRSRSRIVFGAAMFAAVVAFSIERTVLVHAAALSLNAACVSAVLRSVAPAVARKVVVNPAIKYTLWVCCGAICGDRQSPLVVSKIVLLALRRGTVASVPSVVVTSEEQKR